VLQHRRKTLLCSRVACTFAGFTESNKKDFADLTDGIRIVPAPYLARYDWILVKDTACLSRTEWLHYLEQSYKLVKAKLSKKDREELEK
jgi:predicted DNA-binding protein (MmcQ/YjbR family)